MIMSARDRVVSVVAQRIEAQAVIAENRRLRAKETLYAGQNRVQPLGTETPIRPRGLQANSGVPVGAPVQFNQGLAAATPRLGNEDTALLQTAFQELGRRNAGFQSGTGDPNMDEVLPRYPYDAYVRLSDSDGSIQALWIWNESADPREWKELSGGVKGVLGSPIQAQADASVNGTVWIGHTGMIWVAWDGLWNRQPRITKGPNPPEIIYSVEGDTHHVPQASGADSSFCTYIFHGGEWALATCCRDSNNNLVCDPQPPPPRPYEGDYPINCSALTPFPPSEGKGPWHPCPDGIFGFFCTTGDC